MKGDTLYKILNSLGDIATNYIDFAHAFLKAGYGASDGKINYEFHKIKNNRLKEESQRTELRKLKKYLSKLKNDGLILENNLKQIYISNKGKKKLHNFQKSFSFNRGYYKKKTKGRVIVISYDIPVAFNNERAILRDMLRMLGFNLIHKSVWVGKVKLPERFLIDLKNLKIIDHVEILEVTKRGTLKLKN